MCIRHGVTYLYVFKAGCLNCVKYYYTVHMSVLTGTKFVSGLSGFYLIAIFTCFILGSTISIHGMVKCY